MTAANAESTRMTPPSTSAVSDPVPAPAVDTPAGAALPAAKPANKDLTRLVKQLAEAEMALQSHLLVQANAIIDQRGQSVLLNEAQQQLLESEDTQRKQAVIQSAILNALPSPIALIDCEGIILAVNAAWQRVARTASPGLFFGLGQNYQEACDQAKGAEAPNAQAVGAGLRHVLSGEIPSFSREYCSHAQADDQWFLVTITPLSEAKGAGLIIAHTNITERKLAEENLTQRQRMLLISTRLSRIGAWTIDVPSNELVWSEELREILEYPPGFHPLLENTLELYRPESRIIINAAIAACMTLGTPFDMELEIMTAAKRRLWVRAIGESVRDGGGRISRIQGAFQDISERKLAAEESRVIAESLTTTLESITDSFFTLDRNWRFTYVNHQAEFVFQRKRADLLGKGIWDEFPEECNTVFHREYLRAMAENAAVHIEEFSPLFKAWLEVRAYPSALGLAVYFRDVTSQRKSHDDLYASEERFRLLAKATNDAIWDCDTASDTVSWNEGFETLFGYPRTDVESTMASWTNRIHPDDQKRVIGRMQSVLASGETSWSDEFRFRRKDGSYAFVLNRCHIIRTTLGAAERIIGGMTDLTSRKRSEDQIAEQAALLDEARDAISVRDLTHRIGFWNKGAERIYGWTAAEVLGQSARALLYPDPSMYDKAVQQVVLQGEWLGELSPTSKDGRKLLIECRWTLVRETAGKPPSILDICTDITDRRRFEQQVLRAQRMDSIGTLAGGIAHDLNNVLAPIMLSINLLKVNETDEQRLSVLSIIDASAKRGADMVKQVLSFARGVEGQRLPVDIPGLIREMEKIVSDTFPKGIQVRVVLQPDIQAVSGDSTQLHQVILNLCVNARDAMPEGGTITLSAENAMIDEHFATLYLEAKPGPYVIIQVEDSGTGIPPAILEKIFEPFFTTKEIGKGTGLGLSTSLAVVKSHGGFMRVYSELGKGTAFKLFLPSMTSEGSVRRIDQAVTLPRGHGELVLLVDDDNAVRQIASQTLEAYGYRVLLASDGSEAVAQYAVKQNDIAMVLTDMMMPVMDGFATIRVLKKIRPDIKIIAASGLNENHIVAKAMSVGVRHFLTKPYTADSLLNKIHEVLTEK
jgi:PAS domain S-box-containing protein